MATCSISNPRGHAHFNEEGKSVDCELMMAVRFIGEG